MTQGYWSPDTPSWPAVSRGVPVSVSLCFFCNKPIKLRPEHRVGDRIHECDKGFYYMCVIGPARGYKECP